MGTSRRLSLAAIKELLGMERRGAGGMGVKLGGNIGDHRSGNERC